MNPFDFTIGVVEVPMKQMKENYDINIHTINKLTVHAGTFHSDDVFCGAVAKTLNENVIIERVANADGIHTDIEQGHIVADIGMGPFDHHQKDCPYRTDGIKHCGASRLWLVYGYSVVKKIYPELGEEENLYICQKVDEKLLQTIAALDNGAPDFPTEVYSIVNIVEGFRPGWDSEKSDDEGFMDAVNAMKLILKNEIERYCAEQRAIPYVSRCLDEMMEGVVVLEKYCPWKQVVMKNENAKAVVYPSKRGGWNIEPVPLDKGEQTYRVSVPESWRGKKGDEAGKLQKGMTFCHTMGFVIAFDTKENAISAAKILK